MYPTVGSLASPRSGLRRGVVKILSGLVVCSGA